MKTKNARCFCDASLSCLSLQARVHFTRMTVACRTCARCRTISSA
jgi:hypothetical protein